MKSKLVQRVLRALIALLGAGVGAGLTAMAQQMLAQANPEYHVPVQALVIDAKDGTVFVTADTGDVGWGGNLEEALSD